MNADGISYLDMGDAFMRGDWSMAADSVWSPLYAWVLGAAMGLFNPPMRLEFPLVHAVNFVIYVVALLCFLYLWRQVIRVQQIRVEALPSSSNVPMPDWAMLGLGYALFIAASLVLIEIWSVTPDMLMAAFVYLASAIILRIRLNNFRWRTFVLLGIVLGLSYLAKAIMLPVSLLFLLAALFAVRNLRRAVPRVLLAFTLLVLIIAPYVAFVSWYKGEYTVVGAGTFTYAKHVNGIPFSHWQGEQQGNGIPEHPSRRIFEDPPVYEFGTPIGGTYPISYDPSYWNAGLEIYFDLTQQLQALVASFLYYYEVFAGLFGALVFALILFYLMSRLQTWKLADILADWGLAIIAFAVLLFYAVVLVAGRYVGAFVVILFANLLANVRLLDTAANRKFAAAISIVATMFLLGNVLAFSLSGFRDFSSAQNAQSSAIGQARPPSWPGEVAEDLHQLGIKQSDKVGVIGYGFDSFWARLARVQIVAELLEQDADAFWLGDPSQQAEVVQAFATAGAQAIVAEHVPIYASLPDWHQVGDSNYYILLLAE